MAGVTYSVHMRRSHFNGEGHINKVQLYFEPG